MKHFGKRAFSRGLMSLTATNNAVFSTTVKDFIQDTRDMTQGVVHINNTEEFQNLSAEEKKDKHRVLVYRTNPVDPEDNPKFVSYYVDLNECGPMVLDILLKIKNEYDPSLSLRRSCREGICGSCSMTTNGKNGLACITPIPVEEGITRVTPLPHMFVLKDLVVDMTNFYAQYKTIDPYLKRKAEKENPDKEYYQSQDDRAKLDGLYECVLCACCSTSCPSYWWHPDKYLGPAVLMQAYRWVIDSRDQYTQERLEALQGDYKLNQCHQIGMCSFTCPKGLDPQLAIKHLMTMTADMEKEKVEDFEL